MMTRREKDEVYQMFPGTGETGQGATELVPMIMSASQVKYLDPVFLPSLPIRNRPGMQEQTTLLQPPTSEDPPHCTTCSCHLPIFVGHLSISFYFLPLTQSYFFCFPEILLKYQLLQRADPYTVPSCQSLGLPALHIPPRTLTTFTHLSGRLTSQA